MIPSLFVLLLCLTVLAPAHADTPLEAYRAQALRLDPGFYTSVDLRRLDGTRVQFDHFGSEYETVFEGHPEALEDAKKFRDMRVAGTILSLAGLSLLIAELALILVEHDSMVDTSRSGAEGLKPLTFVFLGSGLALNISGILLEVSALGALDDAVQHHNDRVLNPRSRGAKVGLRVGF